MSVNRKCLTAFVLLAILAIMFGFLGTVAPSQESVSPKQGSSSSSSSAVTHFTYPPSYDSEWVNITDKCGEHFTITHNLGTKEITVDITGKQTLEGGEHTINFGIDGTLGWSSPVANGEFLSPSIIQTWDGGYAIAASIGVEGGPYDYMLVITDSFGHITYSNRYAPSTFVSDDLASDLIQTSEPGTNEIGYAIVGSTHSWSASNGSDAWLVKTSWATWETWDRTYGTPSDDYAYSLVQTDDGGYAIAGATSSSGNDDIWLFKTDSEGNLNWSRTYGGLSADRGYSLVSTEDGGYAIACTGFSNLLKTFANGTLQWAKSYGGNAYSLVETVDGGYALAGERNGNMWLVKTDSKGYMQWNRTYTGTMWGALSLIQTADGGYALTEGSMLLKTDQAGNQQWNMTFKTFPWGYVGSVIQSADGGYVLPGGCEVGPAESLGMLFKTIVESGLSWTDSTNNTITLYRGKTDPYWNYVRVRIWLIKEPTWQYGDINQDGVVDAKDLYIVGRNYGKTLSLLSLGGIVAIAGVQKYKIRKQRGLS